jgi:hypothetical protein
MVRQHCERFGENAVKSIAMKITPLVISLFVLVGCAAAPSPRAEATSQVKPIVAALQAYHHDSGDYPRQLDELRPHYLRTDVPFHNSTETKPIWYCFYDRVDQNHYSLQFYTTPCSEAIYKNGSVGGHMVK